jgi:integrase
VRVVFERYLEHLRSSRVRESTFELKKRHLNYFLMDPADYGSIAVRDFAAIYVYEFIEKQRQPRWIAKAKRDCRWGDGAIAVFVSAAKSAFAWALKAGLIDSNPVQYVEGPSVRSRSRDCILSAEDHQAILKKCRPALRDIAIILENTGARPSELVNATADAFREDLGALVYFAESRRRKKEYAHKTGGHKKERTILMSGEALEIVKRQVARHPNGPLFFNSRGRPWTRKGLVGAFFKLRRRLNLEALSAYSYRHTFATRWLEAGGSVDILAELIGNSPQTIRLHYAHLFNDRKELRKKLEEMRGRMISGNSCPS